MGRLGPVLICTFLTDQVCAESSVRFVQRESELLSSTVLPASTSFEALINCVSLNPDLGMKSFLPRVFYPKTKSYALYCCRDVYTSSSTCKEAQCGQGNTRIGRNPATPVDYTSRGTQLRRSGRIQPKEPAVFSRYRWQESPKYTKPHSEVTGHSQTMLVPPSCCPCLTVEAA